MSSIDKCSWLIKAAKDAPGFKIKSGSTISDSSLHLHYIEYTSNSAVLKIDSEFIDGLDPQNAPNGKYYD